MRTFFNIIRAEPALKVHPDPAMLRGIHLFLQFPGYSQDLPWHGIFGPISNYKRQSEQTAGPSLNIPQRKPAVLCKKIAYKYKFCTTAHTPSFNTQKKS
jgi:hypothetical protein